MNIHIELGGHNVLRIVVANGSPMDMNRLNGLAGIGNEKSHSKHIASEPIVTSGGP